MQVKTCEHTPHCLALPAEWEQDQTVSVLVKVNTHKTKPTMALLPGTRTLLGALGLTTRKRTLLGLLAILLGARTLLGAPGLTTIVTKTLLGAPHRTLLALLLGARTLLGGLGLTTRNKDAARPLALLLGTRTLLGAPGLTARKTGP